MTPILFLLGMILFLGIHSTRIVMPAGTRGIQARIGEGAWKGLYSVIAVIGFVLIIWFYRDAQAAWPILYTPPSWMRHINLLIMVFAMIAIMIYALPAGKLKPILKHPMLVAVKLWALGHLLANGDLASVVLFGGFLLWAVADRISVKRRDREFTTLQAGEPARISGPVTWDIASVIIGLGLYVLFVVRLHLWLFGVSPVG